jgi:hypothetical protein
LSGLPSHVMFRFPWSTREIQPPSADLSTQRRWGRGGVVAPGAVTKATGICVRGVAKPLWNRGSEVMGVSVPAGWVVVCPGSMPRVVRPARGVSGRAVGGGPCPSDHRGEAGGAAGLVVGDRPRPGREAAGAGDLRRHRGGDRGPVRRLVAGECDAGGGRDGTAGRSVGRRVVVAADPGGGGVRGRGAEPGPGPRHRPSPLWAARGPRGRPAGQGGGLLGRATSVRRSWRCSEAGCWSTWPRRSPNRPSTSGCSMPNAAPTRPPGARCVVAGTGPPTCMPGSSTRSPTG